jgi:hypothetical protein
MPWAALPGVRVDSADSGNAMYRLGDDRSCACRGSKSAGQVKKEQQRSRLAPYLPLEVPVRLGGVS